MVGYQWYSGSPLHVALHSREGVRLAEFPTPEAAREYASENGLDIVETSLPEGLFSESDAQRPMTHVLYFRRSTGEVLLGRPDRVEKLLGERLSEYEKLVVGTVRIKALGSGHLDVTTVVDDDLP